MQMDQDELISSLYEKQYDRMYQIGYRLTGDAEKTQDVIQSTFLLALFHKDRFLVHPNQAGWLIKTLKNLIENERRRLSSRDLALNEDIFNIAAPGAGDNLEELLPTRLRKEDRDILMWRFSQELDYRAIANILGISQSGCRDRVARAIKRCRALLEEK